MRKQKNHIVHFCFHLEQIKRCVGTDIQRIIRDHYQQLYYKKMENLEEMEKFLEKYNLSKLNQEEIENLGDPSHA